MILGTSRGEVGVNNVGKRADTLHEYSARSLHPRNPKDCRDRDCRERINMKLTLRELLHNYDWDKACEVLGLNPWCINEGLASGDEEQEITDEQAREIGILPARL